ncbi:hypothetical protein F2Y83_06625 [Bacteroides cellulosilyticus]|nr:hypothetical protein F2Y70_22300 [Bacteroides cellulosilyticus]KAA5437692.1 hypothetical protein F2Y83_06625 [Bacteroides cellulosilyticus]KAA5439001.1 hypothetical protein F2Y74_09880 [Bacteroides cellulosilyticus]
MREKFLYLIIHRYFIVLPTTSPYGYSSFQEEENLRYFRVTILSPINYHLCTNLFFKRYFVF